MKFFLLIFLSFSCLPINAHTCFDKVVSHHNTTNIVLDTTDTDPSTTWYSSSYIGDFSSGECHKKIDITKVVRDTIIDSLLCRIIGVFTDGVYLPESEIITYMKADKMYFYEEKDWRLLYDFAAVIGDTVTYYVSKKYHYYDTYSVPTTYNQDIIDYNPYQLVIKSIDTIHDESGRPLKRFMTERIPNIYDHFMGTIIEKVGSTKKLFGNNTIISLPECNDVETIGLRCYSDEAVAIKFTNRECDQIRINPSGIADDATWYYTPASRTFTEKIWRVKALNDIIIGDQTFKFIGIDKGQGVIADSQIPIAFAQDKILFYESGATHILFDFNVAKGDTLVYKTPSKAYHYDITFGEGNIQPILPTFRLIVENIDTLLSLEGKLLRRFISKPLDDFNAFDHGFSPMLENVGDIGLGFFGAIGPFLSIDKEGYFRCFQSTGLNYSNLNKDCLLSSVEDVNTAFATKLYPNPGNDQIHITLGERAVLPVTIRVSDIGGHLVLDDTMHTLDKQIKTDLLLSGIYIVTVVDAIGNTTYNKWVKN